MFFKILQFHKHQRCVFSSPLQRPVFDYLMFSFVFFAQAVFFAPRFSVINQALLAFTIKRLRRVTINQSIIKQLCCIIFVIFVRNAIPCFCKRLLENKFISFYGCDAK